LPAPERAGQQAIFSRRRRPRPAMESVLVTDENLGSSRKVELILLGLKCVFPMVWHRKKSFRAA
jgi:hypothetical protein